MEVACGPVAVLLMTECGPPPILFINMLIISLIPSRVHIKDPTGTLFSDELTYLEPYNGGAQ